ncbi:MAG TPA: hypothetical protein DDW52_01310 [Planctomycetaceae bacterium]|nr:hypothetical protein [Planctomycetaceae bacterium]
MKKLVPILVAAVLLFVVFFVAAIVWPGKSADRTGRALIGKPVANSIAAFMSPEELRGASYVLLSDMYDRECNARFAEFSNLITRLNEQGVAARMLHIGSHGSPNQSLQQAASSGIAPTQVVVAASSVVYDDAAIRQLRKPCMFKLVDGEVVEVFVGAELEDWIRDH